mmetsp:Transcript_22292/g.57268  ORF Transcript_22292/g.57268 Transcript_22292/m.57268 type:complete len:227 (-) Transcript_22292:1187-1867(-)
MPLSSVHSACARLAARGFSGKTHVKPSLAHRLHGKPSHAALALWHLAHACLRRPPGLSVRPTPGIGVFTSLLSMASGATCMPPPRESGTASAATLESPCAPSHTPGQHAGICACTGSGGAPVGCGPPRGTGRAEAGGKAEAGIAGVGGAAQGAWPLPPPRREGDAVVCLHVPAAHAAAPGAAAQACSLDASGVLCTLESSMPPSAPCAARAAAGADCAGASCADAA